MELTHLVNNAFRSNDKIKVKVNVTFKKPGRCRYSCAQPK